MPLGQLVHCVESHVFKGGTLARAAGTSMRFLSRRFIKHTRSGFAGLKLPSGKLIYVPLDSMACSGHVSNRLHNKKVLRKAGVQRNRGRRPVVRGVAMNPIDHPHGGGEGKTSGGRHPVTPWGRLTKGVKTCSRVRKQKYQIFINKIHHL